MARWIHFTILALLTFVAASCAAGGGTGDSGPRRSSNQITTQELSELVSEDNAYDAIRRLRPIWLSGRGQDPVRVFVDGVDMGGTNVLRNYRIQTVREIRFTPPSDATMRYGTGFGGGVIEVLTR